MVMSANGPCLMIQGTSSGVGKSVVAAAFCRLFARAGYRVAPFKSQNMALNSAVTIDGGEIGRAQAAQAEAALVEATVDMNPILLKPENDHRAQVVVRGAPVARFDFHEYRRMQPVLLEVVRDCLTRLRRDHDLIVIEGAGSPVEINLRDADIVNMRVARMADARVLLVGDIDRGGVFASLVGTMALLEPDDRARIAGFIVNKFRGDASLLTPGLQELELRTGVRVLGVVPWVSDVLPPAEDSLDLEDVTFAGGVPALDVAVVRLPRIANFDDFEPLAREPRVRLRFTRKATDVAGADFIVLPGSKSTIADLAWLRESGMADAILDAARRDRPVLGICGGYQMLGDALHDPECLESETTTATGLGLLPLITTFAGKKTVVRVEARVTDAAGFFGAAAGSHLRAYEIHVGRTDVASVRRPFAIVSRGGVGVNDSDGATNPAGTVVGTYLHGLFANDSLRGALLRWLATRKGASPDPRWGSVLAPSDRYDRLADVVAAAVDVPEVAKLVGLTFPRP